MTKDGSRTSEQGPAIGSPLRPVATPSAIGEKAGVAAYPVGDAFAGRAVDGRGRPIDRYGSINPDAVRTTADRLSAAADRTNPTTTRSPAANNPAILGRGQCVTVPTTSQAVRMELIERCAAQVRCDRVVLCLVGEPDATTASVWDRLPVGARGAAPTLVASSLNESAAMRVRAADQALALVEFWCERGEHVLLILCSVTELAAASREAGSLDPSYVAGHPSPRDERAACAKFAERCGIFGPRGAISAVLIIRSEETHASDG